MDITEFRGQYPQYADVPDQDLARSLHEKFYSDVDYSDFSKTFIGSPKPSDYLKSAASGALSGAGMIAQGGGELLARGINAVAPSAEARAINPFQGAIDWLETSKSPGAKAAEAGTQISGSLLDSSTWDFGSNPTLAGLALQGVNAIGQFAPNLAIALGTAGASIPAQLTIGATVGGLQALGGGAEEERNKFSQMGPDELQASSALYRTLTERGVPHETAKNAVAEAAALGGGLGNAIPSAAEGAFENFLVGALTRGRLTVPGKGLLGKTAVGAVGGAALGGTEEAIEQVGQNIGSNIAIGGDRPLTADTLQQFVMGAIAEGVAGGGGGAVSHVMQPNAQPVAVPEAPSAPIGSDFDAPAKRGLQVMDQAPDVQTSIQAATAIVEAPLDAAVVRAEAFAKAEQDVGIQRQSEEDAAYRQREDRIAQLNRMIAMELERDATRTEAGKRAELTAREEAQQGINQEQVRGVIAQAAQSAPPTAMAQAFTGAANLDRQAGYVAPEELLRRMEDAAARGLIQQPEVPNAVPEPIPGALDVRQQAANGEGMGVQNSQPVQPAAVQETQPARQSNALTDEEIARQMTASIPQTFTPAAVSAPAVPTKESMVGAPLPMVPTGTREDLAALKKNVNQKTAYQRRNEILPERDTLFSAIAKLGGLNKQEVVSTWGVDPADFKRITPIFGKPLVRTNGGESIDGMAELLVQHGYLDQRDLHEFERKFDQELRGKPVLTPQGEQFKAAITAKEQAEEAEANSLGLTHTELAVDGYTGLNEPEKEQYQTILDALVQHAQGQPYEALVDDILERAAIQAGDKPYREYAQSVIRQIREVINAQHPDNQLSQNERGAGRQSVEENHQATGTEGRAPAAQAKALELTSTTPAELKAAASTQALASREAAERKAIADREREHFSLTPQAPAERVAAPSQQAGLFTPTGKPSAQSVSTQPQEVASPEHGNAAASVAERPYRDTPTKALQKLAHEAEGDTLTAVEDELNMRAEEKAKTREERLAKGRAPKEQPAKEPAKMSEALRVKPHEPENAADVIAAAEAAVKPAIEMSAAEHLRAAADKLDEKTAEKPTSVEEITDFGEKIGGARKDTAQATGKSTKVETEESAEPGWRKRFRVYEIASSMRQEEKGRWAIQDTRVKGWRGQIVGRETYATKEAAEKALPLIAVAQKHRVHMGRPNAEGVSKYTIWREVTDRKRVQVVPQEFNSREDAMRYMAEHAAEIIEKKTAYGEEILARPETVKRIGEARRTGPATKEMFADTFGFRGVEFGNWNNQDERQEVMNHAYDGLLDLAELLGVPPKAISLNGELALAFGARGQGLSGAKAHYEMDYGVINLTKMSGAGSLAHEWFHALDHYLARQDTKAKSEKVANERGDMVYPDTTDTLGFASHGFRAVDSKVREELRKAYTDLIQTMFTKAEQYVEDTQKAEKFVGDARESLAKALAEIRLHLTRGPDELTYMKRNNKPASAEQLASFDQLAEKLTSGQDVFTAYRPSPESAGKKIGSHGWMSGRHTNDTLEAMSAIYKAVRGRSGFNSEGHGTFDSLRSYIARYSQRINMLKSATSGEEKTKRVPTSYAMENKKIDQGRSSDYWTTEHEMAARAFSAFVEDKIAEQGNRSDFLSYGADNNLPWYRIFNVRPFPEGKERIDINKAFDKFVGELKTNETEKGIALFSRKSSNGRTINTQPDETYRAQTNQLEAFLKAEGYAFKITPVSVGAADNAEANGAKDSFALAQRISGLFDKEVIPVTAKGDFEFDGVVLPGSPLSKYVFIDASADKPAHVVLGHELSHHMEKDAPAVYKDLVRSVKPLLFDLEGYREARAMGGASEDYIVKEMIGDLLGNNFGNPAFWTEVASRSTAFGKIVATIRQWLSDIVAKLKSATGFQVEQFVSDAQAARKILAEATVEYAQNRGNGVGGYEAQFSRRTPTVDGKTTGDFRDSYVRDASEYVSNLLHSDARVGWWAKSVGTQQHKALTLPEFKPVYDEGQAFLSDVSKYANGSADLAQDLLPRIEGFKDFFKKSPNKADIETVTDALYAGTLFGGGSPLEGRIWTDKELKQGRAYDENGVSMQAFKPMHDSQIALYHEALKATSKSLDELGKSLIHRTVRTHDIGFDREMSLEDVVADVQENLDDAIAEAKLSEDKEAAAQLQTTKNQVGEIAEKTQGLKDSGYFPAMRFGKYAVYVVDPKTERQLYFGLFESQTKANLEAVDLKKQYPAAAITRAIMSQEQHRLFQGLSLDALETFADYITGADGQPLSKDPLVQGFLKAAVAERSVLKRHIHRKGIAGYSEDMPRVLASFTTAAARHTAMNYHGAEMGKLAQDIKSGDVKDEAIKLVRYLQDPMEEAQGLRGFLFMQYLGGSIANGLVNMTQPFMVTAPYLSQTTSASDAAIQLMKASAAQAHPEKLQGAEAEAYKRAHREGVVSPQEIHQLRAQTGGLPLAKNLALRKLSYLWGSIYSLTEQFNRATTFIAAYRIAEKKGLANPYEFAKKAVEETQFVYNKGNRPNWARGPVGATVFTFKQFSISYLELAKRLYDKDKKAFALMALMLLAAGGIEGLPFAEDIEDMVDTIGQWLGYATNSKKKVRQWAMSILGPDFSQIALRGVSGLPWMPVDVSARMGMANLIPGTAMLKQSEKNKAKDVIELIGPAGQLIPTEDTMLGRALERLAKGDIMGAVKAGAPRAVQAAVKGIEQLETGQARDIKGKKITSVTPGEAVFQMAGLNPAGVARESQRIGIVQQDIDFHNRMESEIAEQWARGVVDKEQDQVRKAKEKLAEWNKDNAEMKIRIDSRQILQRTKALRMSREERFVKSAPREIRGEVRAALR